MQISIEARQHAQALLDFIDHSPSPWHAVEAVANQLKAHGFKNLRENEPWQFKQGGKYFVVRDGGSIIAFTLGQQAIADSGFRIVGAHTDSPGLRLKPQAAYSTEGTAQLGVEVYGGPILATFTDRDLSLAGRVVIRGAQGLETRLVRLDQPIARLPNLAIHMNREVNDKGLVLNKQTGLPLIFGHAANTAVAKQLLTETLAGKLAVPAEAIAGWDLALYDTQKGSFWGIAQEFIANSQLDNLASCHAALEALIQNPKPAATTICALFDHEEVGSESAIGAGGSFLLDVINRICLSSGLTQEDQLRSFANSFFISADMAHAFQPNHAGSYEPCHHVHINQGPVIKTNANQRYSTNAVTAARFIQLCEQAKVPHQQYAHRTDLGCGSTIGPIMAAQLGIATVDVGNPMWAMHSIRESAGVLDHSYMIATLQQHYAS
ncbi:M18 family aminopeptidase [Methylophilus sp.]|jgi:aspartyl aminopeptidase|uniref:M18 family aminopeptidase n=1 Tax=Methylophilus sp. TaxID=29541 RepID=UPI0011D42D6D|nr:M18 family aminopeptidase [Methylophilus sp.]TXI45337.1 MAG: M18 family aminopeptidase [Methylophilus sp.]